MVNNNKLNNNKQVSTEISFRKVEGGIDYADFPINASYIAASDVRAAYRQGKDQGYELGFEHGDVAAREQSQDFIQSLEEENDRLLGENARLAEENARLWSEQEETQERSGTYRHIN